MNAASISNRLFLAFSLLIGLLPRLMGQTCTGNLLQNPGFETSLNGWSVLANGIAPAAGGNSGSFGLKLTQNTLDGIIQTIPATAGKTYTASFFGKIEPGTSNGTTSPIVALGIKFLSTTWQPLAQNNAPITATTWANGFVALIAPAGTAWVEVKLMFTKGATSTATGWADDVCLTSSGGSTGGNCTTDLGAGDLLCTEKSGTNLIVRKLLNGNVTAVTLGSSGQIFSTVAEGVLAYDSILVTGNQVRKKLVNGTIAWTKTIPQSVLDSIPTIHAACELTTGELLFGGFRKINPNGAGFPPSVGILTLVKTNSSVTPTLFKRLYTNTAYADPNKGFLDRFFMIVPLAGGAADVFYSFSSPAILDNVAIVIDRVSNALTVQKTVYVDFVSGGIGSDFKMYRPVCGAYFFDMIAKSVGQKGSFGGRQRIFIRTSDFTVTSRWRSGSGSLDYYGSYESAGFQGAQPDSLNGGYQFRPSIDPVPPLTFRLDNGAAAPTVVELPIANYFHAARIDANLFLFSKNTAGNLIASIPTNCGPVVTQKPDLRLTNLNWTSGTIPQGAVFAYTFDLLNQGQVAAVGNFTIKTYISTDLTLSPDDIQDGTVPTGNLAANQTVTGIQGASTIPSTLAPGQYNLILKVDADNQIDESNEGNNLMTSVPFTVQAVQNQPDLTINNLLLNGYQSASGNVFSYRFDLANASNTAVPGNFSVKTYLSTDDILSANDMQDGTVITGNFAPGLAVPSVLGATTVPASLPTGQYFVIVKVDADNQVAESNEGNNVAVSSSPIYIVQATNGGSGPCDKFLANGVVVCVQPAAATGNSNIQTVMDAGGQRTRYTTNPQGQLVSTENLGAVATQYFTEYSFVVDNNLTSLVKKNATTGAVVYTKPLPTATQNALSSFHTATEFGAGYVLMGGKNAASNPTYFIDSIFALKTDANLNVIAKKYIGPGNSYPYGAGASSLTVVGADRLAYIYGTSLSGTYYSAWLRLMDGNFNQKSEKNLYSGIWSAGAGLAKNLCRGFTVTDGQGLGYCKSGGCHRSERFDGEFVNDQFVPYNSFTFQHNSTVGNGVETSTWLTATTDGGRIEGTFVRNFTTTNPGGNSVELKKYSSANALVWTKTVNVPGATYVQRIAEANGTVYFYKKSQFSDDWTLMTLACLEGQANPCSPDVTPPVFAGCPVSQNLTTSGTSSTATWTAPTATDACPGAVILTTTHAPGAAFPIGTTTVIYTAKDAANNSAVCTFSVTVTQTTTGSCGTNLLTNPSFENNLTDWEGTGGAISATASAGTKSVKLAINSTIRQTKPATAGTTYSLFFKAKGETAATKVLAYIKFLSNTWQPLVTEYLDFSATATAFSSGNISKAAPAGTAWVEVGFLKQTAGAALVDEVCLSTGGGSVPLADLTLTNLSLPNTTVQAGGPLAINFTASNIGTGDGPNPTFIQFFLSTNNNPQNGAALLIGTVTEPVFTPNLVKNLSNTVNIPSTTAAGQYWLIGIINQTGMQSEPSSTNNFAIAGPFTVTATAAQPDLTILSMANPPSTVPAGQPLPFSFTLKNQGTGTAASFFTRFYLSSDVSWNANDTEIGYASSANWVAGDQSTIQAAPVVPTSIPAGNYFLILKTDADGQVAESNEANNELVSATAVSVTTTQPPLGCTGNLLTNNSFESGLQNWDTNDQPTSVTGGANSTSKAVSICASGARIYQTKAATAGKQYTFKAFLKNNGTAASGTVAVKFLSSTWQPLGYNVIPAFAATSSYQEVSVQMTAPTGAVWVEASIEKTTGAGCLLADEACLIDGVAPPQTIDLALSNPILTQTTVAVGGQIVLKFDIANLGNSNLLGSPALKAWLSVDATISANDILIGSSTSSSMAPGASILGATFTVTIPAGTPGGGYFILLKGDADNQITESNEANNLLVFGFSPGGLIQVTATAGCNLTATASGIACDNVGTATPSDDRFFFSLLVQGNTQCGTTWQYGLNLGTIGTPKTMGPFNISNFPSGIMDLTINTNSNPPSTTTISVPVPAPCSSGGGTGADLKVTLTANKTTVSQWGNVTYTVTAKNEGTANISQANISISVCDGTGNFGYFVQSTGLVYASVPSPPTAGTYNLVSNLWQISNLAPGAVATLTLPLFTLTTAEKKVFAWSALQLPTDPDSQPGSLPANCTPSQDDEAVWVINLGQSAQVVNSNSSDGSTIQSAEFAIFPNPTDGRFSVNLGQFLGEKLTVSVVDAFGKTVFSEKLGDVREPYFDIDLSENPSGVYFLKLDAEGFRPVVKRLIISKL